MDSSHTTTTTAWDSAAASRPGDFYSVSLAQQYSLLSNEGVSSFKSGDRPQRGADLKAYDRRSGRGRGSESRGFAPSSDKRPPYLRRCTTAQMEPAGAGRGGRCSRSTSAVVHTGTDSDGGAHDPWNTADGGAGAQENSIWNLRMSAQKQKAGRRNVLSANRMNAVTENSKATARMPPPGFNDERAAEGSTSGAGSGESQQKLKPMKLQFYRTKMCPWVLSVGYCRKGSTCRYAHSPQELRPLPDLARTKMCEELLKTGRCPNSDSCKYAHSLDELRATQSFSKTKLCPSWKEGHCVAGLACRFAHGEEELRSVPAATAQEDQRNTEVDVLNSSGFLRASDGSGLPDHTESPQISYYPPQQHYAASSAYPYMQTLSPSASQPGMFPTSGSNRPIAVSYWQPPGHPAQPDRQQQQQLPPPATWDTPGSLSPMSLTVATNALVYLSQMQWGNGGDATARNYSRTSFDVNSVECGNSGSTNMMNGAVLKNNVVNMPSNMIHAMTGGVNTGNNLGGSFIALDPDPGKDGPTLLASPPRQPSVQHSSPSTSEFSLLQQPWTKDCPNTPQHPLVAQRFGGEQQSPEGGDTTRFLSHLLPSGIFTPMTRRAASGNSRMVQQLPPVPNTLDVSKDRKSDAGGNDTSPPIRSDMAAEILDDYNQRGGLSPLFYTANLPPGCFYQQNGGGGVNMVYQQQQSHLTPPFCPFHLSPSANVIVSPTISRSTSPTGRLPPTSLEQRWPSNNHNMGSLARPVVSSSSRPADMPSFPLTSDSAKFGNNLAWLARATLSQQPAQQDTAGLPNTQADEIERYATEETKGTPVLSDEDSPSLFSSKSSSERTSLGLSPTPPCLKTTGESTAAALQSTKERIAGRVIM